ncbi:MAG TPA: toxic anion resistance protein, partial [Allosphingosinicella sp.]
MTLEAPKPLAIVQPEQAAGLVPLKAEEKTELEQKVDSFVTELVALDSNSPEFGKKVDQLTSMGRKEIAEAAGHSNRFLDRPVKAIDKDTGIGADLTELRRTVESLDPAKNGRLTPGRKLFGLIPFGGRIKAYFRQYQSAQTHISAILARLASG